MRADSDRPMSVHTARNQGPWRAGAHAGAADAVRELNTAALGEAPYPPGRVLDRARAARRSPTSRLEQLAQCEKRRGALLADPEWVAAVAKTQKDGQLVENISSRWRQPRAPPARLIQPQR